MIKGLFGFAKYTPDERDTIVSALLFWAGSRDMPHLQGPIRAAKERRSDNMFEREIAQLAANIKRL